MSGGRKKMQKRYLLLMTWLFLITVGLTLPVNFVRAPSSPTSAVESFKEPFKDFFDYEWWLQGSEYGGKGLQYGKWMVVETFWDSGVPRQRFYITNENPLTGTDSARMEIDGSKPDVLTYAWRSLWESPDPDRIGYPNLLNPAYLQFKFRIDEWTTSNPTWRVTLGAIGGAGPGESSLEGQVIIGLEGLDPPKLRLHYRVGSSIDDWTDANTIKVLSETSVDVGETYTLEIMRLADPVNGTVAVWLDGIEIADLRAEGLDTSYPGGERTVFLGNNPLAENGFFATGSSTGSSCVITFDDLRTSDQYIGVDPSPINHYDLTLDSSPQGKTVRVGNHIVGTTPITIQVPEGTIPKIGVEPANFDHWEISPNFDDFSSYSETWPNMTTSLVATVTRAPAPPGENIGPSPTPAIYRDTRITAIYTNGVKHTLDVNSNPVATSFTVDQLDYETPWNDSLTEGTHTITVPSTFTIGEKRYDFRNWEDDSTNATRTVNLVSNMDITAYYDETTIPEFTPSVALLAVITATTLAIALIARKWWAHTENYRHFHLM
jgi:hypothetical protein